MATALAQFAATQQQQPRADAAAADAYADDFAHSDGEEEGAQQPRANALVAFAQSAQQQPPRDSTPTLLQVAQQQSPQPATSLLAVARQDQADATPSLLAGFWPVTSCPSITT